LHLEDRSFFVIERSHLQFFRGKIMLCHLREVGNAVYLNRRATSLARVKSFSEELFTQR